MTNNNENIIEIKTEDGKTLEGEILFTFEANGDDFIVYAVGDQPYPYKIDEHKNLTPVKEDEWPLVEKIFNQWVEEQEAEDE